MKTIVHTPFDCVIKIANQNTFLAENENFSFKGTEKIYVYPTKHKLSFVVDYSPSPFYSIVEKNDIRHIFLLDEISVQNVEIHNASFVGGNGTIEKHFDEIIFYSQEHKKIVPLTTCYENICIGSCFHIGYALLSSAQNETLVFFNFKNGKSKVFQGEQISFSPPHFEIISYNKKTSLTIDKTGLKQHEKPNVVILENPLFPYLPFVQGLKEENYSFCHSLLNENLRKAQNESDIKSFFGSVQQFFPLSHNQVFVLADGKGEIYSFSYENGKICDISTD